MKLFRTLTPLLLVALVLPSGIASADDRPVLAPGENNHDFTGGPRTIEVTPTDDAMTLLECLLGPEVVISNVSIIAAPGASGLFTGGLGVFGFDEGVVLSSGNILTIVGPNVDDYVSYNNGYPGDPDLDNLIPGYSTNDATILEFDFECEGATEASFQYVFASEEYNEYVDSQYNDVVGLFLNGANIAFVPTVCSDPYLAVAINNVNCSNPYNPPVGLNCDCYNNNDLTDGGPFFDTEMDGLTQTFFAEGPLLPGVNHIKIAIADAGDFVLDSNVMIRCGSFTCGGAPETGACCFPTGECFTLTYPDCQVQGGDYYGDNIPCDPNPCEQPTAVCCFEDGQCQIVGEQGCIENGGIWHADWDSCDPNPCPQPVAVCCFEDGSCELLTEAACDEAMGVWHFEWDTCDPNPCVPTPSDQDSWGQIKARFK